MPAAQLNGGIDPLFHPLANLFPMMGEAEHAELVEDVRRRGIRSKIVLHEGLILDGRNRYLAGVAAGIIMPGVFEMPGGGEYLPQFRAFVEEHDGAPLAFVLSTNLHRRHLSESQRAMVAAKLESFSHGGLRITQDADLQLATLVVTRAEAAEIAKVSPRSVASAKAVLEHGAPELAQKVETGEVAVSLAAELARLPVEEQREVMRTADPAALYKVVKEQHAIRQQAKKARRAEREQELGEKIAGSNAALVAAGKSGKRYAVVLADPEWPFDVYSSETGMDRSPDNHYPTSPVDVIMARPVPEIMADDCALLLWVTGPHLENGFKVLNAWGFSYRSHWVGVKDRIGTGYWNRNMHELLLLGIRGNIPAPAMGEQFDSVQPFPVREHSRKPEFAHLIAEHYWPTLPKIELNAREARETWDVWGAEAPEPVTIGVDLAAGPDVSAEVVINGDRSLSCQPESDADDVDGEEPDGGEDEADEEDEPAPKAKGSRKAKAPKQERKQPWQIAADERQARIDALAADLPGDLEALTAAYGASIDLHHFAVMREDADAAAAQRERMDAILFRANGCAMGGIGVNDAPTAIRRANWAPCGTVPKWGQTGQFIVEHRGVRAIVSFGGHEGVHAVDFNRPFPSQTGFHSISATREPGMSVVDYGKAMLDGAIDYRPEGKGAARKLVLPESVSLLERDERGYLLHRERGVVLDPEALPAGLDLAALGDIRERWREEDRAGLYGKKGKRSFPECLHWNDKIIAIDGETLTPVADFPTSGAYVVTDRYWDADGNHAERWRYVADAARLDERVA